MHQNYHFLRHLTEGLRQEATGLKFMECFSQEKDELVIILAHARGKNNYYRPFSFAPRSAPISPASTFPKTSTALVKIAPIYSKICMI